VFTPNCTLDEVKLDLLMLKKTLKEVETVTLKETLKNIEKFHILSYRRSY